MANSTFSCPACAKKLKTSNPVPEKKLRCPGCQASFVVPNPPTLNSPEEVQFGDNSAEQDEGNASARASSSGRRRPRAVRLAVAGIVALLLVAAAVYFAIRALEPRIPPVWDRALAAKLTLTVSEKNAPTGVMEFPKRDYGAELKGNLRAAMSAVAKGEWERVRLLQQAETKKKNGDLEVILYLFSDREPAWPRDNAPLKGEIWGSRMPLLYDLSLDGQQREDGAFKGQVTGRVRIGNIWVRFQDADFLLQPWTVKEGK